MVEILLNCTFFFFFFYYSGLGDLDLDSRSQGCKKQKLLHQLSHCLLIVWDQILWAVETCARERERDFWPQRFSDFCFFILSNFSACMLHSHCVAGKKMEFPKCERRERPDYFTCGGASDSSDDKNGAGSDDERFRDLADCTDPMVVLEELMYMNQGQVLLSQSEEVETLPENGSQTEKDS